MGVIPDNDHLPRFHTGIGCPDAADVRKILRFLGNTEIKKIRSTKSEIRNNMIKAENPKMYDLEERTLSFAKRVRIFCSQIRKTQGNIEDGKQVIRSSGSIGANYIEANESLSKKDFLMRIKISRKEAKESKYWLMLIDTNDNTNLEKEQQLLIKEASELMMIFSSIMRKSQ